MWQKIFLIVLVILAAVNVSNAGNRVALVIGNGAYTDDKAWRTLRNPPNDAASISNSLRKLGFTVFVHTNLEKSEMRSVIAEFGRKAYQAEVAVFFFAGHGIQNKSQNFLMPTDVKAYSLADAVDQGINLNLALEELDNAQSEIKIVMLDACRENPYSNEYRGTKSGLAPVDVTNNMIIVYSTQPGNIAADRVGGGKNSPFTSSLVEALQSRDLSLGNVLKVTSKLVKKKTGKQQVPYVNGPRDLDDFMLAGEPVAVEDDPPPVLPVEVRQHFEPEMVNIPAGSFEMGSPSNEEGRNDNEGPVHTVHVKAFQMGKYEVTVGQYLACVQDNACKPPKWKESGSQYNINTGSDDYYKKLGNALTDSNHPIVGISWNDSNDYTAWLSRKTGRTYRLPTEAEWEYAARAGTNTKYWWGNEIGNNKANCDGCGSQWDNSKTSPVGSFEPNPWGLYDTAGNVWELTCSDYTDTYDGNETTCKNHANGSLVIRGGSWYNNPPWLRSANRYGVGPSFHNYMLGFRLIQD